jgi:hypothetical protein
VYSRCQFFPLSKLANSTSLAMSTSFPCSSKSCGKVFRTQNAVDQHFFSFHNKAAYDATIKAAQKANEERRRQEREEAGIQLAMGNKPESQMDRLETLLRGPNPPFSETVLQKNGYHEPPRFNGQPDPTPRFVAQNRASEMGPPSRGAPLTSSSHDKDRSSRRSSMLNTEVQRVGNYASPSTTTSEVPQYEYYENDAYFSYGSDNAVQKDCPEPLPCEDCSFLFRDQESLDYHISTKHRPPPCFVCHKPLPRDQSIDEHLETVAHECAHCHTPLPLRKSGVVSHMWFSHPFVCRECGCSLPNSSALGRHMSTVHGNGGIWCQVCQPPCGRTFDTQEGLDGHIKSVLHGNSKAAGTRRSEYGGTAQWVSQNQARRRAREEKSSVPESSRSSRRSGSRRNQGSIVIKEPPSLPARPEEEEGPYMPRKSSFLPPVRHEEEGTFELGSPPRPAARHKFNPLITDSPPQPSTRRKRDLSVAGSSAGSTTHHTEISSVSGRFPAVVSSDENRFRCNCGSNTCIMSCEGHHTRKSSYRDIIFKPNKVV